MPINRITNKTFYNNNFSDVIEAYKGKCIFCGDKLYVSPVKDLLIGIMFTGVNQRALNYLQLEAKSLYGPIDETLIPFTKIFYAGKRNNMDKSIISKVIDANSGVSTIEWSVPMEQDDIFALNEIVLSYIDAFKGIGESAL